MDEFLCDHSPPEVDRIWIWESYNKIPIHHTLYYLLKRGDIYLVAGWEPVGCDSTNGSFCNTRSCGAPTKVALLLRDPFTWRVHVPNESGLIFHLF